MSEEVKKEEPKKKGPLGRLKDKVEDADEQMAVISTLVRLGILVWSGGILTLNYVTIPGLPQQKIDPTFIASVFTGVLATFGVQTAKKSGDGTMKMNGNGNGAAAGVAVPAVSSIPYIGWLASGWAMLLGQNIGSAAGSQVNSMISDC